MFVLRRDFNICNFCCLLHLLRVPGWQSLHGMVSCEMAGYGFTTPLCFFFQAEDGIRDWSVTGVQTCALPICERQSFLVYAPPDTLRQDFNVFPGRLCHRGEVIATGAIDTGDQVFVDKCSYNFVKPHNGDVFVFRTNGIPGIREDPVSGPPFYIKRLAGLPGDQLRVDPPFLYINGKKAEGYGFERVMSARPPYRGYALGQQYLSKPDQRYTVPRDGYFALGDNSYNSYDSRYWGPVPVENLVGRGLFVYWPFYPHWGLIR